MCKYQKHSNNQASSVRFFSKAYRKDYALPSMEVWYQDIPVRAI